MLFRRNDHFRFPWCRKSRVQDSPRPEEAKPVSEAYEGAVDRYGKHSWNDGLPEIVKEIVEDANTPTEGIHIATLVDYDYGNTKTKGTPYIKLRLKVPYCSKPVFCYLTYSLAQHPFFKFLLPTLLNRKIKIRVSYSRYGGYSFVQTRIMEIVD